MRSDLVRRCSLHHPTRGGPVLSNLVLFVQAGTCIAFVGTSGCGKSTTARRFYGPLTGRVLVGITLIFGELRTDFFVNELDGTDAPTLDVRC